MSLALFRKWLRQKIEHRVVPSVVFGSERLAFRRLGLADMATQRARLTPGCVADMCTTAGISAIRMSSARPSGSLMRYGEAARSSACSPSTRLMDLSAYGSPPSTRPRLRLRGRQILLGTSGIQSAHPQCRLLRGQSRVPPHHRRQRFHRGEAGGHRDALLRATAGRPLLFSPSSAPADRSMSGPARGARASLPRTPRSRPCRDIARRAPRTRFA